MRRRAPSFVVVAALVAAALPLTAPPALAARAATAGVDRTISYRGQTYTYSFSLTNSSTAGESIASVRVQRPSTDWTLSACPQPPAGWTVTSAAASCT